MTDAKTTPAPTAGRAIQNARAAILAVRAGQYEAKTVLVREGVRAYFVTPSEYFSRLRAADARSARRFEGL
jgi:hypothetical protein